MKIARWKSFLYYRLIIGCPKCLVHLHGILLYTNRQDFLDFHTVLIQQAFLRINSCLALVANVERNTEWVNSTCIFAWVSQENLRLLFTQALGGLGISFPLKLSWRKTHFSIVLNPRKILVTKSFIIKHYIGKKLPKSPIHKENFNERENQSAYT